MPRYNKSRYHEEPDYKLFVKKYHKGSHFAKIVKWSDSKGTHLGIVEGQRGQDLSVFVFNKENFGNRRTTVVLEQVEFY